MKTTRKEVEAAIDSLNLTTVADYCNAPIGDDESETDYWAATIVTQLGGGQHTKRLATEILDAHLDALIAQRIGTKNESTYPPHVCPPPRPRGGGPEHSCPSPSTCTAAPDWWEDHCHVWPLLLQFRELNDTVATKKKPKPQLIRERDDAYAQIADYYHPIIVGSANKFSPLLDDDVHAYAVRAALQGIEQFNLDGPVPLQAYLRTLLPRRIVDRLRSEGAFTRSEYTVLTALQAIDPEYSPGDPMIVSVIEQVAERARMKRPTAEATLRRIVAKVKTLRIEFGESDDATPVVIPDDETTRPESRTMRAEHARIAQPLFTALTQGLTTEQVTIAAAWFTAGNPGKDDEDLERFRHLPALADQQGNPPSAEAARANGKRIIDALTKRAAELSGTTPGSTESEKWLQQTFNAGAVLIPGHDEGLSVSTWSEEGLPFS